MNKNRRKALEIVARQIADAKTDLEAIRDEEQEAYDNLPEGLQQGDKGQAMDDALSRLNEAIDALYSVDSNISDAIGG